MTPQEIDQLICGWSMMQQHGFSSYELDSLVDLLDDKFREAHFKERGKAMRVARELMAPDAFELFKERMEK